MKRLIPYTILTLLLSGSIGAQSLAPKPKPDPKSDLPKEVSLTEVQRLKLENAQLKLRELDRQIKELQKQISDELIAAMKLAGVPESEFGNYGFDQNGKLIYVDPKAKK
jgi:hypothetical protein